MKAVLHLPVAEQYPSRTATVDSFASKRTSGMSGGLFGLIEQIRTEQLKHHQARFRYPVGAPLRHGPVRYFKDLSHCASATK